MKGKYRIYVIGDIPPDLKERIMAVHVAGILKGKGEGMPVHTQVLIDKNGLLFKAFPSKPGANVQR